MVVVAAVSTLVLTGVALRNHLHERSTMGSESAAARRLATSAAELVVHAASSNAAAFQEAAAAGTLFEDFPLRPGFISATVTDADTKAAVTATTTNYRVIARADTDRATSRIAMLLETPDDDLSRLMVAHPDAVAYWPIDEFNQTTVVDQIGGHNGVYGVASAAGAFTHAHGGPAPRMNWMTEYVQIPHDSAFVLANGTLTFWVRFDLKPTSAGFQMGAVSKENSPATSAMNLAVYLEHDYLYYSLNNAGNRGATVRVPSSSIAEGTWHFVAISWGNDGMKLYLDGTLRAEDSSAVDLQAVLLARQANTFDWYFGVRNIPESIYKQSRTVFGSVARVGLFNTQLSESDIQTIHAATSQPPGIVPVPGSFATVVD
jgi:hypothetical protein